MTKSRLLRIQREFDAIRGQIANVSCDDLEGLAEKLGRVRRKGGGGGHHLFDSPFPGKRHINIPCHPSSRVGIGLAERILNELEPDIDTWFEWLRTQELQKKKKVSNRVIGRNGHG